MNLFSVTFGEELKPISLPCCWPCSSCCKLPGSKEAAELAAQGWATGTVRSQRHLYKVSRPRCAAALLGSERCDQEICFRGCLRAYKSPVKGSGCWQLASAVIVGAVYHTSPFLEEEKQDSPARHPLGDLQCFFAWWCLVLSCLETMLH